MCYAAVSGQDSVSSGVSAGRMLIAVIAALVILVASGCVHRSGTMVSGGGTIYNNAVFNITPMNPVLTPMGITGGARRSDTGQGQMVVPSATAESSQGVSATGTGNIVINFRQGSTETQAPMATGINATLPASMPSSGQLLQPK